LEDKLTKLFISTREPKEALRLEPQRVKEVFAEIFQNAREERDRNKPAANSLAVLCNKKSIKALGDMHVVTGLKCLHYDD